jgi:acyl carrier protein
MAQLEFESLKQTLKALIVKECDKDIAPEAIGDEERLIGGPLELDSLDALQICLAVKDRYDVRLEGNDARRALVSVSALAQMILDAQVDAPLDTPLAVRPVT